LGRDSWIRQAVERYEGPLVRYAFRITGQLDQARDVVQDVFVRLWKVEHNQVDGHLAEWLFRVCRNRALDVQRKEYRMQTSDDSFLETKASLEPPPDKTAAIQESFAEALRLVAKLPPNQQEVVRLKFQNDLSYQEISQITRLSVTNVGYLIHTALKTLRHQMQGAEK
jgi:RNA polymerase sigma factor (sigma-70 family)